MFTSELSARPSFSPQTRLRAVVLVMLALAFALQVQHSMALASGASQGIDTPAFVYETVYSGPGLDSGRDVAVDAAGNAYVLAYATSYSFNDVFVLKVAPDGTVLWTVDLSGSAIDYGTGITVDDADGVYVTGWTDSADFPLVNPLQSTLVGFRDVFITKLSALDGSIIYSTFLGGDYVDQGGDIAVNSAGEMYIVGLTESTDFPTMDPIQDGLIGPPYAYSDIFVTKLSADGGTILYSTYLGGSNDDAGTGIGLDASGRIYIAGDTESDDFPTVTPIQASHAGEGDLFVARIAANGSALDYSTYLGGEDWDRVNRIAVDDAGNAYLGGTSRSVGFPTTPGAYQEDFAGEILGCEIPFGGHRNCDDVFVAKLPPDGSALLYSTYLGGIRDEEGRGVAFDGSGRVYVAGYTNSPDFPPTGSISAADIYVSQLSADGSSLNYTVLVDSGSANAGGGLAVDGDGDIYLTGALNVPADTYVTRLSEGAPPEDTLHVDDIRLRVRERGSRYLLQALVTVRDQDGGTIEGAEVTADVTVPPDRTRVQTSMTDVQGRASFRGASNAGGAWEVCVTDIVKAGFAYDPAQNNETCDSSTYP